MKTPMVSGRPVKDLSAEGLDNVDLVFELYRRGVSAEAVDALYDQISDWYYHANIEWLAGGDRALVDLIERNDLA